QMQSLTASTESKKEPSSGTTSNSGDGATEKKDSASAEGLKKNSQTTPQPTGAGLLALLMGLLFQVFSLVDKMRPSEYAAFQPLASLYVLLRIFPSALKRLRAFTENPATLLRSSS